MGDTTKVFDILGKTQVKSLLGSFFKDNLKKTLNLARTQRNERTKRIKLDRYRHAKISHNNSYAPNVICPKTNSYADYPASRKFISPAGRAHLHSKFVIVWVFVKCGG